MRAEYQRWMRDSATLNIVATSAAASFRGTESEEQQNRVSNHDFKLSVVERHLDSSRQGIWEIRNGFNDVFAGLRKLLCIISFRPRAKAPD